MRVALKTLKKYMEYIKNMFETNITNGVIEGLNNKIKLFWSSKIVTVTSN